MPQPETADINSISIIIPVYNEAGQIIPLLESLRQAIAALPQTPELIISDGGSTDSTVQLARQQLEQWQLPWRIISQARGRGQQLAAAAQQAQGCILIFLHADSRISSQYFHDMLAAVGQGAQWGCGRLRFDCGRLSLRLIAYFSHLRVRYQSLVFGDQTMFCRRSFYQQVGGFAPMFFMEDYQFSERAAQLAKPVELQAPVITSARRYRQHGVWHTNWQIQKNKARYRSGRYSLEELAKLYED